MRYTYTKEELQAAVRTSNGYHAMADNYRGKNIGLPGKKLPE